MPNREPEPQLLSCFDIDMTVRMAENSIVGVEDAARIGRHAQVEP